MMKKCFSIEKIEYGWFKAGIYADGQEISIDASYFEDFVSSFINGLLCALGLLPQDDAITICEERETEHVLWQVNCVRNFLQFCAITYDVDIEKSRVTLTVDRESFLNDFISEFDRILAIDGFDGFKENWYLEFPKELYAKLKTAGS